MFSHYVASSSFRPCLRTLPNVSRAMKQCRGISTSNPSPFESVVNAEDDAVTTEDPGAVEVQAMEERSTGPKSYKEFLEQVGYKYRSAEPSNWLASHGPFPMNPSFRPPPPISEAQREAMYKEYMWDPLGNSVRALSQRYNLSLKRVDAILRLKGLEKSWKKKKTLQTGFQTGMDWLLNATTHNATRNADLNRYDVHEADVLEEEENRDASRQRYQRLYWESVLEDGQEPIVPSSLQHAREKARLYAQKAEEFKAIPQLMPRVPDTEFMKRPSAKVLERENRPSVKFIDVGAKFMDVNERIRRIATAGRKSRRRRLITEGKRLAWKGPVLDTTTP